jgi:amicyanin
MKNVVLVIVAVVVLAGAAFALTRNSNNDNPPATTDTQSTQNTDSTGESTQNTTSPSSPSSQSQTNSVEIKDFAFTPSNITVKKGTAVTWTNRDSTQHNVLPDDQKEGSTFQGSELLAKDASYSFTFNTPGTYKYHCGPHPQMTATVIVTE